MTSSHSNMKRPSRLVLALIAAGMLGGAGATYFNGTPATAASPLANQEQPLVQSVTLPDFAQIAQRYGDTVVNISVRGLKQNAVQPGISPDDPLFDFFKRFPNPNGPESSPQQGPLPTFGQGSGFIVSPDGLILTNAHVVREASEVVVKLNNRKEYQATVLGSDPKTDIAVLKIDAKNLPSAPLGNPNELQVGEWVLAIGSPFGFENSVTAGVVSAKHRSLPDDSFVPFIQTDVAVNPGNSGGPLFNSKGEVVGINAQIFSQTGGYQGLSFAIPIDLANKIKTEIVATGQASHARLGVAVQEVNQTLADSFKLDKPEGALVSSVDTASPAEKAGLQAGDIILRADGKPIVASGDLPALIGTAKPGQDMTLEIWRQGEVLKRTARLGNIDKNIVTNAQKTNAVGEGRLGLALRPLQPEEQREAQVQNGMLVEQVRGSAALAGVQPGDVLIGINGVRVNNIEQIQDTVKQAKKSVALLVQRNGRKIFLPVRIVG
ncbi:MAG: Do family serine endopeptidase [Limnobacter sp.]|uniref:Do family serine endopeptidase n=1 Tax=Limnobacter sp. TaxID=2003368 RepID=UPI0032EFBCA7